jgi:hypothetical protein
MNECLRFTVPTFRRRMADSGRTVLAAALAAAVMAPLLAGHARAETVYVNGWMPNNDPSGPHVNPADDTPDLASDYRLKGDVWTLSCPKGARLTLIVDTKADRNDGKSNIDPHTWIFDSKGNLVDEGDDEMVNFGGCTHEPVCGYDCARTIIAECSDKPYTLAIADGGPSKADVGGNDLCLGGGGYVIKATAVRGGKDVSDEVVIGGGPKPKLPKWLVDQIPSRRPLIDDDEFPFKLQ